MKSYLLTLTLALACCLGIRADVVTSTPTPLQQNSTGVSIFFHADEGNQGMMGLPSTAEVYAHTGVITNKSTSDADWKHGPAKWGDNSEKYKLAYVSPDLWRLDIGDINSYYGVGADETVLKLAFVFRTGDLKKEGKAEGGTDIFLDVLDEGFQVSMKASTVNSVVYAGKNKVTYKLSSTAAADLEILCNGKSMGSVKNQTYLEVPITFEQNGNYTITGTGLRNGQTAVAEMTMCYAPSSQAKTYPYSEPRQGAVRNSDGSVTFTLCAPGKTNAMLMPSWTGYSGAMENAMNYTDFGVNRFFWVTVPASVGLDPDQQYPYYYLVDGSTKVGDPYAKLILDPYNDKYIKESVYPGLIAYPEQLSNIMLAVYHENINKYDWKVKNFKPAPKQDLIIYELLLRDFTGTEGAAQGNGTVRSAMKKIPYLKELGINAIELLPIQEFDGNLSWGYNTNFYFAPDKAYGTPDDYKEFIDLCHENGIAVFLDLVFNQSAGLHPWYQLYGNAEKSYFYNGTAPHGYSVLNDWNQDHSMVEQQWTDCVAYWLKEYNVDGFRFDLVKGLGDNNSYGSGTDSYNASRVARMSRIHAAMEAAKPGAIHINENLAGNKEENEMAADGQLNWANVNNSSCQYAMGYSSDSGLQRFYAKSDSRTIGSTVSYAESHDEERMGYKQTKWGQTAVKASNAVQKARIACVGAQMLLQPGAHMIWQFSELGNQQTTKDANGGNNTGNKTVEWSVLDDPDTQGCFRSWSELAALRTKYAHLFGTDATFTSKVTTANWANGRYIYAAKGDEEILLVLNPNISGNPLTVTDLPFALQDNSKYKVSSKTYATNPTFDASARTVTVAPNSYAVITRANMAGIEEIPGFDSTTRPVNVYGACGNIIILGEYTQAECYSLQGQRMPLEGLNPGLYIVTVDGQSHKVLMR